MSCTEITQAQRKKNIYKHTKSGRSKAMEFSHIMRNTKFDLTRKNVECNKLDDGYIYIVGGEGMLSDNVNKFNGFSWTVAPSINVQRSQHDIVAYNDKLYVIGGKGVLNTTLDSVEQYDGVSWSTSTPLLVARFGHTAVVFNGGAYIVGGFDDTIAFFGNVHMFNGNIWVNSFTLAVPRYSHSSVVYNGELYVIGGICADVTSETNSVEKYNGTTVQTAGTLLTYRARHCSVVYRGKIYVIGGRDENNGGGDVSGNFDSVEVYDGNSWIPGISMLTPRYNHTAVVYNDLIYVIGGNIAPTKVDVFNGTTWTTLPDDTNLPAGLVELKSAVYNK